MTVITYNRESSPPLSVRLKSAAELAGLTFQSGSARQFGLNWGDGQRCDVSIHRGWFAASRSWVGNDQIDPLSAHARWAGPAKVEQNGVAIVSLQLPIAETLALDDWCDPEIAAATDDFLQRLLQQLPHWVQGNATESWDPPAATEISDCLSTAGYEVAIDEQGSLRTALKRKGCDGQVLIERKAGRLRLAMRLGAWSDLREPARQAMLLLLRIANHQTRMVRLAWSQVDSKSRCDAVIDLTGFPVLDESNRVAATAWSEVLRAALAGLQLTLDRLGLELDALADPMNQDVAEAFLAMHAK